MSRSRRKSPWYKYGKLFNTGEYNRKFRRVNKIRVSMGKEPLKMYELVNPYNVWDWKSFITEEYKHLLRK